MQQKTVVNLIFLCVCVCVCVCVRARACAIDLESQEMMEAYVGTVAERANSQLSVSFGGD